MRIRTKLLVLLLGIAVIPLAVMVAFAQVKTRKLGRDLAHRSRESLTRSASAQLGQLAESRGAQMRLEACALDLAVQLQAREVEQLLAGKSTETVPVVLATDFDREDGLPPGTETDSVRYVRRGEDGSREPMPVSFETAAFWLAPGVAAEDVREILERSAAAHLGFGRIREASHIDLHWQYFALEEGVHCTFPGHGGYPETYDPRVRDWYRRAKEAETTAWNLPAVDASTRQVMMSVSRSVRRPDGRLAGVTGIDFRLSDVLESVVVPEAWAAGSRALIVRQDPGSGTLAVIAKQGYLKEGATWDAPIAIEMLREPSPGFVSLIAGLEAGRSGVEALRHEGRDCLWGYSLINDEGLAILVIVPTELVLAEAVHAEEEGVARTREQLLAGVAIFLIVAGLAALAAIRGARAVTRPMENLAETARAIAAGDLSARAEVTTGDEVEELAESFNTMVPKLEERMRIRESLQLAMEVQQSLLPARPPRIRGLDISGVSIYCDETGGDYFDFLELRGQGSGKVAVVVGDVSGHGIAPALLMATARALLRSRARRETDLTALFSHVNRELAADSSAGRFMTLFYLLVDRPGERCRWVSAGHEPALVFDPVTGEFSELMATGLPLGIEGDYVYSQFTRDGFVVGEVILLGTDGIWETRNAAGEFFGLEAVRDVVREHAHEPAESIQAAILAAVDAFRGDRLREDDLTLVVLKVTELDG